MTRGRSGEPDEGFDEGRKSKSQAKREMTALQDMGERLAALPLSMIRKLPVAPDLREALAEAKGLTRHEARRRQMQYVGRLMREENPEPLARLLEELAAGRTSRDREFKGVEARRDRLVALAAAGDEDGLAQEVRAALDESPGLSGDEVARLAREAARERAGGKPPKAFRALFRALRLAREKSGEAGAQQETPPGD
jgi:ribosome-associated protein